MLEDKRIQDSWRFPPRADWSAMGEQEHFVQFYETDTFLLDSLKGFIGAGLNAGDGCIVVSTQANREGLDERLRAHGVDVERARAAGQYVTLDAGDTLSKFIVDGSPEPLRFADTIGGVITRVSEGRQRVRIFGDMVALLWADGNRAAAVRLEELWNGLQEIHPFSLFCAYPMRGFGGEGLDGPLGEVCSAHARVIPAESYTSLAGDEERLRAITLLQQKARTLEAEIAERKRLHRQLQAELAERDRLLARAQAARAEAEKANRLKDEFLATLSHELRTPLTSVLGWATMLRTSRLDEKTSARALEIIERNAKAQAKIVEDVLDVSRIITGKLRLDVRPLELGPVIQSAVDIMHPTAKAKGVRIRATIDPSAGLVAGDPARVQQVIWNLLSNSVKFTPKGGSISVQLLRAGSHVRVVVRDTGQGIAAEFLPYVFDRFRQADMTTTRQQGGLGLGLSIVRHLVELHGGQVSAKSAGEGRGSTFTIDFPLMDACANVPVGTEEIPLRAPCAEEGATEASDVPPSLEGLKVLVVDDERDGRALVATILENCGARVRAASSAQEALVALEEFAPDVLVSDIAMPEEDGYALMRRVRALKAERGGRIPAVALTAYAREEDRMRALLAGFHIHVTKPPNPNELVAVIGSLAGLAGRAGTKS